MRRHRLSDWLRSLVSVFRVTRISLVDGREMFSLLGDIGRLDDLRASKLLCAECGGPVTAENLYAIVVRDGEYCFLCDRHLVDPSADRLK
jgi:hypothetical protein